MRKTETHELYPGITLHVSRDDRLKTEFLAVNFILSGELYDRPRAKLLPEVLSCGTKNHPCEAAIKAAALDLYNTEIGLFGYATEETYIERFSVACHKERFLPDNSGVRTGARDLLFETILDPLVSRGAFKKVLVDNKIKNALDRLKAEKNNKPRYAVNKCLEILCENEPVLYPAKQQKKELSSVGARDLYAFYLRMLGSAPIEIFYSGEEETESLINDLLLRIKPLCSPKSGILPDVISPAKLATVRRTEAISANQSVLCIGYKMPSSRLCPSPEVYTLLREMLCNSPVSLLFMNVREKLSLCYFCSNTVLSRKGVYLLYLGIDRKNAEIAEKAVCAQVNALRRGDFDGKLLETCKKSLTNYYKGMRDSVGALEGWYLSRMVVGRMETPETVIEKLMCVTKEKIAEAANTLVLDTVFLLDGVKDKGCDPNE